MSFSLTDEEKLKLDLLLSDIDSEKYSTVQTSKTDATDNSKREEDTTNEGEEKRNYFKLDVEEVAYMQELDKKLNDMIQSYEDRGQKLKEAFEETKELEDFLENVDNSGKLWKHFNLQQRLERIEKDLTVLASQDAEANKTETENDVEEIDI